MPPFTETEETQLRQLLEEIRAYKDELADLRKMLEFEKGKAHPSDESVAELRRQIEQLQKAMGEAANERKAIRERTDHSTDPDPDARDVKVTGNEFLGF